LTLDNDVAAHLKAEARRTGRPFKDVVNEMLRVGLAQRKQLRTSTRFSINARDMGDLQPGVSLDNVGELLDQIEGPDHT
jgi:hypothetical protein